jgi:hypothetical protein
MKRKPLTSKILSTVLFCSGTLFIQPALYAQVKIGVNPTTIEANSSLEVEASTSNRKIKVDKTTGQMTIKDGTEGNLKVLTSDANGGATWQALRTTAISSFSQSSPGVVMTIGTGAGGSFCPFPAIGSSPPPPCATDLNRNANFSTANPSNDVVIDFTGLYSVASSTANVQFFLLLYIDKTTPGVYELVDSYFISESGINCSGGYMNYKTTLKNLPARSYNVKVYQENWYNPGTPATIGIGAPALGSCGQPDFANQKLTISVSQ